MNLLTALWARSIVAPWAGTLPDSYLNILLSENGLTAVYEGLITPEQAAAMPGPGHLAYLLRDNGLTALREGLITPEQAVAMPGPGHLNFLLHNNGLSALRDGLITAEEAAFISVRNLGFLLLNNDGFTALREGLITPKQMATLPYGNLEFFVAALRDGLITPAQARAIPYVQLDSFLNVLREGLITPAQMAAIPAGHLTFLSGVNGLAALREKLITPEQIAAIPTTDHLKSWISVNGLAALREKLITPEQVAAMPDPNYLDRLLNEDGLAALREKLITPEQAAAMPTILHLGYLLNDGYGLIALREKLITPEQIAAMPDPNYLDGLLNENGLTALRARAITPEQAAAIPTQSLRDFLFEARTAIILHDGLVTPGQIAAMPTPYHLEYLSSESGRTALRERLITPEQIASILPGMEDLRSVFNDQHTLICLRFMAEQFDRVMTREQAAAMPTIDHLMYASNEYGLTALHEGLITPEQVATISTPYHLQCIFSENGLAALRFGLTPEQIFAMSNADRFVTVHQNQDISAIPQARISPDISALENMNPPVPNLKKEIAKRILETPDIIRSMDSFARLGQQRESSMDEALTLTANTHFENAVKPLFKDTFEKYGATQAERLTAIEQDIRRTILATIQTELLQEFGRERNEEKEDARYKTGEAIQFIEDNREALISGDPECMAIARTYFTSNADSAQIAWRAYDPDAPVRGGWPNLFTVPHDHANESVFTTNASSQGRALSQSDAVEEVRIRAAYYFLVAQDVKSEDGIAGFIDYLAQIRRAHNDDNLTQDDPSCFPGHITRIAMMGALHPIAKLPVSAREIIDEEMQGIISRTFLESIRNLNTHDEKRDLFDSLVMLSDLNVRTWITTPNASDDYTDAWTHLRIVFSEEMDAKIETYIAQINDRVLHQLGRELSAAERTYIKALSADPGGSLFVSRLTEIYLTSVEQTPASPLLQKEDEEKQEVKQAHPFPLMEFDKVLRTLPAKIPQGIRENMAHRQVKQAWDKHHCFDAILPMMAENLPGVDKNIIHELAIALTEAHVSGEDISEASSSAFMSKGLPIPDPNILKADLDRALEGVLPYAPHAPLAAEKNTLFGHATSVSTPKPTEPKPLAPPPQDQGVSPTPSRH